MVNSTKTKTKTKKMAAGTVLGGSLLVAGGLGLAHAAPPQAQSAVGDGKVNVTLSVSGQQIGVLQDVQVESAAALAGAVCPSLNLATELPRLDANEIATLPVCLNNAIAVSYTFTQNGPGNSENAPGQNRSSTAETPSSPNSTAPLTAPSTMPSSPAAR